MQENAFDFTLKTVLVGLIVAILVVLFYAFSMRSASVSNYEKIMSGDLSGCKYYSLQHAPLPCVKQLYKD